MNKILPPQRGLPVALIGILCVSGAAAMDASAAPMPSSHPAPIVAPRLDYRVTALKNGLKVVTLEDHHAPVVTLQIWYHVGSKDEPKGKFGFAHLFEHLMFRGSKNVPPQGHARYIEQVGGEYNANTFFDRTLFFETVPTNALDRALWLEADRMASLTVDDAGFHAERHVVEEELRLRVLNAPYGHLEDKMLELLYPVGHPYEHSTIGSIADLESASLADVRAFHDTYYKPDNATLVLVGDFKTGDAIARIQKYFAAIPPRGKSFPRIPVVQATKMEPKAAILNDPLAPLAQVNLTYLMPPASDPDTPVFSVISSILSMGESSRLYRSLVRDKQISTGPGADGTVLKLGGFFSVSADVAAGIAPARVETALRAEVARLRAEPVDAAELAKAKNQALTALVFGSVTTAQTADRLGEADLMYGTPEEVNHEYAQIADVKPADILRVARRYLASAQTDVVTVVPSPASAAAGATMKEGGGK